jgi:heme exporter protein A
VSLLQAHGLHASRGAVKLLRDVSFTVSAGEWLAVRGPNGSGKTTLLRCAAGLTRPDAGSIRREGRLVFAGHLPALKDDLTAEENLRGALLLNGAEAPASAVRDALGHVGLAARRLLPARRLSAGQRRRVGLARLLLETAPVWILDEPLAALDDEGQALFARTLERHLQRGGLALVATHHDLPIAPTGELRTAE